MKQYQVTRKMQVTIPKRLAERAGIRPGDSVVFEEVNDVIALRKVADSQGSAQEIRVAIQDFVRDVPKIRSRLKEAESGLIEDLSRHVGPK